MPLASSTSSRVYTRSLEILSTWEPPAVWLGKMQTGRSTPERLRYWHSVIYRNNERLRIKLTVAGRRHTSLVSIGRLASDPTGFLYGLQGANSTSYSCVHTVRSSGYVHTLRPFLYLVQTAPPMGTYWRYGVGSSFLVGTYDTDLVRLAQTMLARYYQLF